jgi:hypothetical protein
MPNESTHGNKYAEVVSQESSRKKLNDAQYTVKSIKDFKIIEKAIQVKDGTKIKYIAEVTYNNGVTKRRIVGLSKNGEMMHGYKKLTIEEYRSVQTGEPIKKNKKDKK